MSDYNEELSLARRNIEAMNAAMKHFESKRAEDNQRVMQLQETVTQLVQTVQSLQLNVAMLRAKQLGNGATG